MFKTNVYSLAIKDKHGNRDDSGSLLPTATATCVADASITFLLLNVNNFNSI